MVFDFAAQTDRGRVRARNEDSFLVARLDPSACLCPFSKPVVESITGVLSQAEVMMFVVADGMGGHAKGDLASRLVVEHFVEMASDDATAIIVRAGVSTKIEDLLRNQLESCHLKLEREASRQPGRRGMGSTATVALVAWPTMYVANVGDSRCYLFRNQRIQQLTRDHSMAQYLVDNGCMDVAESEKSFFRNQLWNALGGQGAKLVVDFHEVELLENDLVLLCTDGLTGRLNDESLAHHLRNHVPAATLCDHLVTSANAAGGRDNITCVVTRFTSGSSLPLAPTLMLPVAQPCRSEPRP